MKAIIMAGGEGSRLRPLTCDRPKPMVPVGNRPVMEYAVELLKRLDITEIGVTLQYLPQHITDYFGDGSQWGVNLHYFIEDVPLGTAGSVKNAGSFLDETFLVVSGDALTDLNLQDAVDFHKLNNSLATLVLTSVSNPLEYGVVITNPDGSIERFLEKPGWGEVFSDWVNTGIYVLEPEALDYFDMGQKFDFSKDLFPLLLKNKEPMFGCLLEGYWCDIGNLEQYLQSHKDILGGKVQVNPKGTLIKGTIKGEVFGTNANGASVKGPVLIGENCRIGAGVRLEPYTVLGDNVVIEDEAAIKRTVIWNNVYIGKKSSLSGALIGNKVTIKDNVTILQDAAIGDGTHIESRSIIKPQVKIWPYKSVNTGALVSNSLVWGEKANKSLFGIEGIPGLTNWDITPELAAKLGASYGSVLKKDDKVAVSCDGKLVTKMLKGSFISGLMSTGVKVSDLGEQTMPIHRFAVRGIGAQGGVHIKTDHNNLDKCWLQFVDGKGININRDMERKIEGIYNREDFRRVQEGEIGENVLIQHSLSSYLDNIMSNIAVEKINLRNFRILINTRGKVMESLFKELSGRLKCDLQYFKHHDLEEKSFKKQIQLADEMSKKIVNEGLDFGIILDANGERVILVDNRGRQIDEHMFTVLMALVLFKANNGGIVVVPVTASETIEKLGEKYNGRVVRTKTAPWALMGELVREETASLQKPYSQFFMQNDSLYAVVMLMDFLVEENISLGDLVDEIPDIHLQVNTAPCPWEQKGRIMRALISEVKELPVELIDGVKIRHEKGWALVLPHSEEPQYNIYTEGLSQEAAEELGVFYRNKIQKMLQT
ncbi:sugar phosphate nucleotidyltransferase [Desulfitibacter alkalitolerans]|uniref:sugar phosphate nucleotidyltransferase n=1 Tax=Desulfitibacter alkalitolerans TaxID=264641 RepID=UPI000487A4F6|nr:sugar phosphate nucleotidyltransferase [Desulfitibacter alkalitolerans]